MFVIPTEGFSPSGGICGPWLRDKARVPAICFRYSLPALDIEQVFDGNS
jgi:hypothetical protein